MYYLCISSFLSSAMVELFNNILQATHSCFHRCLFKIPFNAEKRYHGPLEKIYFEEQRENSKIEFTWQRHSTRYMMERRLVKVSSYLDR